jgi:hypothetical protein
MSTKPLPAAVLLASSCVLAALALRSVMLGGPGVPTQFIALLLATPSLMTVAGLAYVAERRARLRGRATPGFAPMALLFMLVLAGNWLLLYLLAKP